MNITDWYWSDYKYMITVPLCLFVGFWLGYAECKIQQKVKRHEKRKG